MCTLFTVVDDVRLVGGTSNCTGRLEVKHQREWRTVEPYQWNHQSSSVVCRQLGCGSAVSSERRRGSNRPTWLPDKCVGTESSLKECGVMSSQTSTSSVYLICSGNKQWLQQWHWSILSVCLSVHMSALTEYTPTHVRVGPCVLLTVMVKQGRTFWVRVKGYLFSDTRYHSRNSRNAMFCSSIYCQCKLCYKIMWTVFKQDVLVAITMSTCCIKVRDRSIFKGGYHWREGHPILFESNGGSYIFFPLNFRGVLRLVDWLGHKGVKLVLYSLVISLNNQSIKDNSLPSLTC